MKHSTCIGPVWVASLQRIFMVLNLKSSVFWRREVFWEELLQGYCLGNSKDKKRSCQGVAYFLTVCWFKIKPWWEFQRKSGNASKVIHTPTDNAELKDVFSDVSIKHFDKSQVHMEGFQAHPSEWDQEKIMHKYSNRDAEASHVIQSHPWVQ